MRGDHRVRDRARRRGRRRTPVGFALARTAARPGSGRSPTSTSRATRVAAGSATELMREVLAAFREREIEHLDLDVLASNNVARSLYARWGLKDEVVIMTGSVAALEEKLGSQEAGVVRLDPHPVRRPERGRAGGAPVRPEASRRLARIARRAAAQRLDRRLRRRLRSQPGDAPAARARALRQDGRRDRAARRRARGARADDPLRARDGSSTSTSRYRSSTARCRPATSSASPRIRQSSRA